MLYLSQRGTLHYTVGLSYNVVHDNLLSETTLNLTNVVNTQMRGKCYKFECGIMAVSQNNSVDNILADNKGVYKSIDLRVIAIRKDSNSLWQNFLTVIRFSSEPTSELDNRYNFLAGRHGWLNSNRIKLILKSLPISQWNHIRQRLFDQKDGEFHKLTIDELTIHYWPHNNLPTYKLHASPVYDLRCDEWFLFYVGLQERINPTQSTREMTDVITAQSEYQRIAENEDGEAIRCGFGNMKKAITHYLEARYEWQSMDPNIYIVMPLYAKMNGLFFENNRIYVEVRAHEALPLQINYRRGKPAQYATTISEEHFAKQVKFEPKDGGEIVTLKLELEELKPDLMDSLPDDLVIVSLGYLGSSGSEITDISKSFRHIVAAGAPEVANPLFSALRIFCQPDYMSKVLLDPHDIKSSVALNTPKIFERTVTWLLQSGGYDTIWLMEKEVWRDSQAEFNYGSADILAFYPPEKCLYVIGCSLKPPKPEEVLDIIRLANKIKEKLFGRYQSSFGNFEVKIIPVYVYSWDADPEIASIAVRNNAISISRRGLKNMHDELNSVTVLKPLETYKDEERATLSGFG